MRTYLLVLRRNQAETLAIPEAEMLSRFIQWIQSLQAKGILRVVERLKHSSAGVTIRTSGEVEGPYNEGGESVIGIFLIEVADHAEAKTIARDCPILLSGGSVEIRETEQLENS